MTFKYDKETDSLVIIFRHTEIEDTEEIRPGVILILMTKDYWYR